MESWSTGERTRYGAQQAVGLGLVAGAGEVLGRALGGPLVASVPEALGFGVVALVLMGAVGGALGLLAGPVHTLRPGTPAYRAVALQLAVVGGVLIAAHLAPVAGRLHAQGRTGAAVALALTTLPAAAVLYVNARFWLARRELGRVPSVGWLPGAAAASLSVVGLVALLAPLADLGGGRALADDPSVLVITVDGLRRDDLGALGGEGPTPRLDALAAEGALFTQAVAPSPSTVASHASIWTGLHPLRHRALSDLHPLPAGWTTLPERFAGEGFATGAFVSSSALVGVGLEQGFRVFDAEPSPLGIGRLRLVSLLAGDPWVRREGPSTVARFERWLGRVGDLPFVGWVHLERRADTPTATVDALVGRVLDAVARAGRDDDTLIVVTGATGVRPGAPERGLGDPLVVVPLVVRAPGRQPIRPVEGQVRLVDLGMTALAWVGMDRSDEAEGIELLGFFDGRRAQGLWSALVGEGPRGPLLGMRQGDVKYVVDPADDAETLHDLARDPGETTDVAHQQLDALARIRLLLGPDRAALERLAQAPGLGARREAVLRRLGWR